MSRETTQYRTPVETPGRSFQRTAGRPPRSAAFRRERLDAKVAGSLRRVPGIVAFTGLTLAVISGCASSGSGSTADGADTSFAELQDRGQVAMGVDQYTSSHLFDALPDGGRIELQRDVDDEAGVRQIREHLREIARSFAAGDFSTPGFVHMQDVPGTSVMAARREAIRYVYGDLPRGGEVRLVSSDPAAIAAIHEFMAFQRQDHRAGGADHGGMDHGAMNHGGMSQGGMNHGGMNHGGMNHGAMDPDSMEHEARHREHMAAIPDGDFAADMDIVHELFMGHESIRRTVTNLPDGIRTLTESDDPSVLAQLVEHVERMDERLRSGEVFNLTSPNLPLIFERADRIRTVIERTTTGVVVVQTSDDPAVVAALQAHAAEVDVFVRDGMAAMMRQRR